MSNGISKAGAENLRYLKETGRCPKCKLRIEGHPECPTCHILCGPGHEYQITKFRNHKICTACVKSWEVLDRLKGRRTTWDEFNTTPSPSLLD